MKYIFLSILALTLSTRAFSQSDPAVSIPFKSNSLSIGLLGAPAYAAGLSYEHMFTRRIALEAGVGIFASGLGVKYYITDPKQRRLNYYTGPYFMVYYDNPSMMYYLPVGISYYTKKNMQFSFDAGIMVSEAVDPNPSPWIGAKIGYRFGKEFSVPESQVAQSSGNEKKNFISISGGSTTPVIGIVYERVIAGYFGLEGGIGLFSAGAGVKLYPFRLREDNVSFHIGASQFIFAFPMIGSSWNTYVPIGFDYLTSNNIRYSLDAGPSFQWDNGYDPSSLMPGVNLRIGKAF